MRRCPTSAHPSLALACVLTALAAPACRRTSEGQTAILLTLTTQGPVACVALVETADTGTLREELDQAHSLPPAFLGNDWKTARLTALLYAGKQLGEGALTITAEGRRGSCTGPIVAKLSSLNATFQQGAVVKVEGVLALLSVDADHDGWPVPEDCDDDDPTTYPGAPGLCDGKDHACSGVLDAGCPCTGGPRSCYPLGLSDPTLGVGLCRPGNQSCTAGQWEKECVGFVVPAPERCDELDHDCDGQKGLPSCPCRPGDSRRCFTKGPAQLAEVGRCASGTQACGAGGFFGPCEGDIGPLPLELCNGVDDNCDGTIDEMSDAAGKPIMVRPACGKVDGVCAGAQKRCVNGAFASCTNLDYEASASTNGSTYGPDAPLCNHADHDCDGLVDTGCPASCPSQGATRDCYGPGLSSPALQHLPCRKGTETCQRNNNNQLHWSVCQGQLEPTVEVCDGVDNNCNGTIDELTKTEGTACNTGRPGVCGPGSRLCVAAALVCQSLSGPNAEQCNGLDDDCDGVIDQGFDKLHDPAHCGGTHECRACNPGDACCLGRCAGLADDSLNCGVCGHACGQAQGCCAGSCVSLDSATSCGACGVACGAGETCKSGRCVSARETRCDNGLDDNGDGLIDCQDPASCPAPLGFTDARCCGFVWTDVDHGDPLNCGACGGLCSANGGGCSAPTCGPAGQCGVRTTCENPACALQGCASGGESGLCADGACCTGCLDNASPSSCKAGTELHACKDPSAPSCMDCASSANACITDACGPNGCTHTFNSNACTDGLGHPGLCNQGSCCAGCLDGSGACTPIDAAHCGMPGQACIPSCVDGVSCTQDVCTNTGPMAFCTNPGLVDGTACTDGSASGQCRTGSCCLGCVNGTGQCLAPAAENANACGLQGHLCTSCPAPGECQDAATCTLGVCGFTNKPEGTPCMAGTDPGTCWAGACSPCAIKCAGNNGGGVCCDPGEKCSNKECTCDGASCAKVGGCCSTENPAQCVKASGQTCSTLCSTNAADPLEYCSSANSNEGGCVQGCFGKCSAGLACGGTQCLVPGVKGTDNVCSDGVHPESCDVRSFSSDWCSCDAVDKPETCPTQGQVCLRTVFLITTFHCTVCGDDGTNGLACKGGGVCAQASSTCQ